jgi:hypothetical protein
VKPITVGLTLLASGIVSAAQAQMETTARYRPLGTWVDPSVSALRTWTASVDRLYERANPVRADARPQLAGLRPKSVELLQDGYLRKHGKSLENNPAKARELVLRRAARGRIHQLRGYMAEALFLDRHSEWGYVSKPNASQHDVYRWVIGRRVPQTGQIKFHTSGEPSRYSADMVRDDRAHRFFIPDDHVEATKAYLRMRGRWRDAARVQPLGATSSEIRSQTASACRSIAREKYATYTSLGAALALSLAPTLLDWARGDLSANVAAYQALRSLSLMGVGIGAEQLLATIAKGAIRGTLRGNAIVGTVLVVTETLWLLHEHGWRRAFYQPNFYEGVGGGVSAIALGLIGGAVATGLAAETGPFAPVIGGGVGIVTGAVGYVGGRAATRAILDIVAPELLRREESQRFRAVIESLDRSIAELSGVRARVIQ